MNFYFLFLEIVGFCLVLYALITKGELSAIFLLAYLFIGSVINSVLPASINYLFLTSLISFYVFKNLPFILKNTFTIIISLYYVLLLYNVDDFVRVRPYFFGVIVLFLLIGVLPEIYAKYDRGSIEKILFAVCILVLIVFISNSLVSTIFNYNPHVMYGITSGILYGNLIHADFHILPLVMFFVLKITIRRRNIFYLTVFFISLFFILLTFRRTVMLLTIIGSFIAFFQEVSLSDLKKISFILLVSIFGGLVIVEKTGFIDVFWERYQLRNLDDRDLEGEQRVLELGLVYNDLFNSFDYSPWTGFGLFQLSGENYGKGKFGTRPLHTDPMVLVHSSGVIGLLLYLLMVAYAFLSVLFVIRNQKDLISFFYILLVFLVFFFTGRFTNTASSLIIYLILYLPLTIQNTSKKIIQNQNLVTNL
ncbi:O-antigen ligase family protein [Mongoliitalea daihaiensis]|uniref:O-antigen ligase family protein n=1 Tax=Mongoliitalea daihaiensis TaxID=2782006 RepID=UPI001F460229|nr:hypothetical protein [Mongoliitalea daihaiensis]UJP64909.1 hypothetical protein IPZ59_19305 [Mongoliitalea daihaiensis]